MKSELIIDVHSDEIAIALTEDDRLQEVSREPRNKDTFSVGNIYYGRVKKVMPALNAVFVDVGHEKDAFLHYLDLGQNFLTLQKFIRRTVSDRRHIPSMRSIEKLPECTKDGQIADYLSVGDTLLVQVIKEPINTKGPRLTAEISLAGRNMVLMPIGDKVMVSNKIRRDSERNRLRKLVAQVRPQGYGVIVRTVAENVEADDLDSELNILVRKWEDALRALQFKEPVSLVCEEIGRTTSIIRDLFSPEFTGIYVNDQEVYDQILEYIELISPESAKLVKLYKGEQPIFDKFDITRQLKTGLGRTVGFKNGGYLIIEKTEALFSIDVNSGSKKIYDDQEENAFHYNMLAAEELVHQLRLRDIGGIIIVDFIDMDSREHQQQLYEYVRKLMSKDRARHNILPLSKFGLMQITRQRVRPAVEMDVTEVCPTCHGKGHIQSSIDFAEQLEQQIELYYRHYGKGIHLQVHPYLFAYAKQGFPGLRLKWWYKFGIHLRENQGLGMLEVHFTNSKGQELPPPREEVTHGQDKIERALRAVVQENSPQAKQQPKPQPKAEPKPQPKAEPKPQPKAESKPQPKAEPKPKQQPKVETKVEPQQEKVQETKQEKKPRKSRTQKEQIVAAETKPEPTAVPTVVPQIEASQEPEKQPEKKLRKPRAKKSSTAELTPSASQSVPQEVEQIPESKAKPKAKAASRAKTEAKKEPTPTVQAEPSEKATAKPRKPRAPRKPKTQTKQTANDSVAEQ